MKNIFFEKQKKGIASITIVLLLGFLSILTMTSILTYNAWRWETLDNNIRKDNYSNAIDGLSIMQYIYLIRNRAVANTTLSVYDSYENYNLGLKTSINISALDTLDNCNTVSLPSAYSDFTVKRITAYNQYNNFYNNKTCCTAGIYNSASENELETEGIINTYSKESCKNMNWPNLKNSSEPLITYNLTQ